MKSYSFRRGHNLPLEPGRALVKYDKELVGEFVQEVLVCVCVDVVIPRLALPAGGDLVVGPLAGEVDADAGHGGGRVAEAHGGQVEAIGGHEVRSLGKLLRSFDELAAPDDVSVRVVDGYVEAQSLE